MKSIGAILRKIEYNLGMQENFYIDLHPIIYLYFEEKKHFIQFFMYVNFSRYDRGLLVFFTDNWVSEGIITLPSDINFNQILEYFQKKSINGKS